MGSSWVWCEDLLIMEVLGLVRKSWVEGLLLAKRVVLF